MRSCRHADEVVAIPRQFPEYYEPFVERGVRVRGLSGNEQKLVRLLDPRDMKMLRNAYFELDRRLVVLRDSDQNRADLSNALAEAMPYLDVIRAAEDEVSAFDAIYANVRDDVRRIRQDRGFFKGRRVEALLNERMGSDRLIDPEAVEQMLENALNSWHTSPFGRQRTVLDGQVVTKLDDLQYQRNEMDRFLEEAGGLENLTLMHLEAETLCNDQYLARGAALLSNSIVRSITGVEDPVEDIEPKRLLRFGSRAAWAEQRLKTAAEMGYELRGPGRQTNRAADRATHGELA